MSAGNEAVNENLPLGYVKFDIEVKPGWIRFYAVLPSEFQRKVELERLPSLFDRTISAWLRENAHIRVRTVLPVVEDGCTVGAYLFL